MRKMGIKMRVNEAEIGKEEWLKTASGDGDDIAKHCMNK